jgi:hypothetical protein
MSSSLDGLKFEIIGKFEIMLDVNSVKLKKHKAQVNTNLDYPG